MIKVHILQAYPRQIDGDAFYFQLLFSVIKSSREQVQLRGVDWDL